MTRIDTLMAEKLEVLARIEEINSETMQSNSIFMVLSSPCDSELDQLYDELEEINAEIAELTNQAIDALYEALEEVEL